MATTRLPQVFCVEDKGTGARHLLPNAAISYVEEELNGVGSAEITFDPLTENALEVKLSERELEIQEGDDMVHVGTMRDLRGTSHGLVLKSDGLFDYFKYRFVLTGNVLFENMDQIVIANGLVNYAQDDSEQGANADLNIGIAAYSPSGILRTREYVSERKHNDTRVSYA